MTAGEAGAAPAVNGVDWLTSLQRASSMDVPAQSSRPRMSDAEFRALFIRFKAAAGGLPAGAQSAVLEELADLMPEGVALLAAAG